MSREIKPLAVRFEPTQRARLDLLAKLTDTTVTEIIRTAVDQHLDTLASDPEVAAKAEALKAAIQQEAADQQAALAGLFEAGEAAEAKEPAPGTPKRRNRGSAPATDA